MSNDKPNSLLVNPNRLDFENTNVRHQSVFWPLKSKRQLLNVPSKPDDVNNNKESVKRSTVEVARSPGFALDIIGHSIIHQLQSYNESESQVSYTSPLSDSSPINIEDGDRGDNIMSPVSIPAQQQKTLHSEQQITLSSTSSQQFLAQSRTMELTAASVPAGFPLNYQQLYANNAALYGAPVMFSGAIHAAHASYMAGLPIHAALSPNETYLKAIQAAACGIYSPTALTHSVNPNLISCKANNTIHNTTGTMMALAPSTPVGISKSPQYPPNDMHVLHKPDVEQKKDYISQTSVNAARSSCNGTYLNEKVTDATNDAANDTHFKVPNGKEGSLKHRILRPPSNECAEANKTPIMRAYNTTSNFKKGTYIELANGSLRRVEDMRTEDFIQCAERSPHHQLAESTVVKINTSLPSTVIITFSYDRNRSKVDMEVSLDHPFFVYGQGWASCNPEMSMKAFGLKCQRLQVGDICISLTKRSSTATNVNINEGPNAQRRHSISSVSSPNPNLNASPSLPPALSSTSDIPYAHLNSHAFSIPVPSSHQISLPAYAEMAKLMSSYAYAKGLPQITHEQLKEVYQSQIYQFAQHQQQQELLMRNELKYSQGRTPPLTSSSAHGMVALTKENSNNTDFEQIQNTQPSQTYPLDASISRKRRWSAPENMFDDDDADTQPPRNSHIQTPSNALSPSSTART